MSIENEEISENSQLQAPSAEENVNLETQPNPEVDTEVKTDESVTQEGTDGKTEKPQPPEHFRKGYEALEKDVNERYKPIAKAVEELGGIEVVNALKPLAELITNENADPNQVVQTLTEALLPQHLESLVWSALDNPATQAVVLEDPEVLQIISEKFFGGKSMADVQAALQYAVEVDEDDPEKAALKKQLSEFTAGQKTAQEQADAKAGEARVQDLQKRFFMDTAEEVVKQFNLVAPDGATESDQQMFSDTVEDLRYAAQGRFLHENQQEYLQIQDMYARGLSSQARIAEARLHSKWQGTLLKTAERMSNQLKLVSEANKLSQQTKVQGVRPDVSGNAGQTQTKQQEQYDLNDPDWLTKFQAEFREARLRQA